MMQGFTKVENVLDGEGHPAGGRVEGIGIVIDWQNGPLGPVGSEHRLAPNGAFVEDVIEAARQRIAWYQDNGFACRENALAITKLEEALHWLEARTARRTAAGTEGTHEGN